MIDSLRLIPAAELLAHETTAPDRVAALAGGLARERVQRHPLLAAPLPRGGYLVLDGHHRLEALRAVGCATAATQLVAPPEADAVLETWLHRFTAPDLPEALATLAGPLVVRRADPGAPAGAVATVEAGGTWGIWTRGGGLAADLAAMHRVEGLYRERPGVERLPGPAALAPGEAVVAFRRLRYGEVVECALSGLRLPAGCTRFVVPGRILNLRVPLDLLNQNGAAGNARLRALVQERLALLRYYPESVYLFE